MSENSFKIENWKVFDYSLRWQLVTKLNWIINAQLKHWKCENYSRFNENNLMIIKAPWIHLFEKRKKMIIHFRLAVGLAGMLLRMKILPWFPFWLIKWIEKISVKRDFDLFPEIDLIRYAAQETKNEFISLESNFQSFEYFCSVLVNILMGIYLRLFAIATL